MQTLSSLSSSNRSISCCLLSQIQKFFQFVYSGLEVLFSCTVCKWSVSEFILQVHSVPCIWNMFVLLFYFLSLVCCVSIPSDQFHLCAVFTPVVCQQVCICCAVLGFHPLPCAVRRGGCCNINISYTAFWNSFMDLEVRFTF